MSPCLRRHTFCQQRQKVYKKRRQKSGFLDFLSAPRTFKIVGVRPTRLEDFAKGLKCGIASALAPLPLNMQNVGAFTPIAGRRGRRPERKKYQLLHFAPSAAAAQEIAEAPPVADEARRFRGSVPIGGREAVGNLLTRRCSQKRYYISCPLHGTFKHVARIPTT